MCSVFTVFLHLKTSNTAYPIPSDTTPRRADRCANAWPRIAVNLRCERRAPHSVAPPRARGGRSGCGTVTVPLRQSRHHTGDLQVHAFKRRVQRVTLVEQRTNAGERKCQRAANAQGGADLPHHGCASPCIWSAMRQPKIQRTCKPAARSQPCIGSKCP